MGTRSNRLGKAVRTRTQIYVWSRNMKNIRFFLCLKIFSFWRWKIKQEVTKVFSRVKKMQKIIQLSENSLMYISDCVYVGKTMRKRVLGHIRTAKAQISLCICAISSGPSLSVNIMARRYRMYQGSSAHIILCACAGRIWRRF